jgi:glycosyltransferase involved in cell wall biosynthesis
MDRTSGSGAKNRDEMMQENKKPHFLFAAFMAGGNATILQNLQSEIECRKDVSSSWERIDLDLKKLAFYGEKKSFLVPGTFRNSHVTAQRVREHKRRGVVFDAAYFFQHTICMGLVRFRSSVPHVIAMDGTPMFYAKNELWYAHPYFNPKSLGARIKYILKRDVYRRAFHLLPLSTKVRESLVNDYGISPEKVTVMPPGIDLEKFSFQDRSARGRSDTPFKILFTGADFIRKGGEMLATVAAMPEFHDVKFIFVTKSYSGPKIENMAIYDDISPNSARMVRLLHDADIFVLPTHADSFSVASLEGMATGLPVITVGVGGIQDILEDGETGFLIPRDDIRSLVRQICTLKGNPQLGLRMGLNARTKMEAQFDSKIIGEKVVELLKQVAEKKSSVHSS